MEEQHGIQPSEEDIFYVSWGRETVKNNITLANDILKQLITISSALLGITIIYERIIESGTLKVIVLLSFFSSLVVAFLGILPYEAKVQIAIPNDIKTHKTRALKHKSRFLWISAGLLIVGFFSVIAELLLKLWTEK